MADDAFQFTLRVGGVVDGLVAEAMERRADAVILPLGIEVGTGGAILDTESLNALARRLPMPLLTVPMRHRWRPGAQPGAPVTVVKVTGRRPVLRGRMGLPRA
jgi:hypothetical protein